MRDARFLVLGNPANRRVVQFVEAVRRRGLPEPIVAAWRDVVRDPAALLRAAPDHELFFRIDSAGEDDEVERMLLMRGHARAVGEGVSAIADDERPPPARGRILAPRQAHLGLLEVLDGIDDVFADRPSWRPTTSTRAIRELFDKRWTSRRYRELGVPVPRALEGARDVSDLREIAQERGTIWIKLASGSSASCLAVLQRGGALMTTVQVTPEGWFNSLRVRRIEDRARADAILAFLLREGSQVEEDAPKARLDGRAFDLRVLCVAGEPAFVVVRTSTHPITNLHLGGRRGDVGAARALVGATAWESAMQSCRTIAREHDALHVGIDVAFLARGHGHVVFEANAFGDLLPGLARDGLSVYEWQIERALERRDGGRS